jgi:two-component system KDP operon response regulator KdpE
MAKVLLVDNDPALLELLVEYLGDAGWDIATADNGAHALALVASAPPELVVLDVAMPVMDGWQTLRALRAISSVPVIMLTARTREADVLQAFSLGADDYVPKPFSFAQLQARIRALLTRSAVAVQQQPRLLSCGDVVLCRDTRRLTAPGKRALLSPTEFRLLVALMERPGTVMSHEELALRVWANGRQAGRIRRCVWYLRRKIEDSPESPVYVRNARGAGYYFVSARELEAERAARTADGAAA